MIVHDFTLWLVCFFFILLARFKMVVIKLSWMICAFLLVQQNASATPFVSWASKKSVEDIQLKLNQLDRKLTDQVQYSHSLRKDIEKHEDIQPILQNIQRRLLFLEEKSISRSNSMNRQLSHQSTKLKVSTQ